MGARVPFRDGYRVGVCYIERVVCFLCSTCTRIAHLDFVDTSFDAPYIYLDRRHDKQQICPSYAPSP